MANKTSKKKKKISLESAISHIFSSMNNTIITFTDEDGKTVLQESAGTIGYKGTKKATPYVANLIATKIGKDAIAIGVKNLKIKVNGIGRGKEIAIRTLIGMGFNVSEIADVTPIPHNGCTPSKKPR